MAGYMGCADRNVPIANGLPAGFWSQYTLPNLTANAVQGFAGPTVDFPLAINGSDVLVVRYASGTPHVLSQANAAGWMQIRTPGAQQVGSCVNGLCAASDVVVTNCVGARIFRITQANLAGDVTNILHAGAWPAAGSMSPSGNFFAGSELLQVSTVVFYVGMNPAGRPSLFRRENQLDPIEIVDGVQLMRLTYRDRVTGVYAPTAAGTNWEQVDGVRVELLLQGNEDNVIDTARSYQLAGEDTAVFADRRHRQVFATTIALRSRL
jgi:type IV pilus assembly protein PilW